MTPLLLVLMACGGGPAADDTQAPGPAGTTPTPVPTTPQPTDAPPAAEIVPSVALEDVRVSFTGAGATCQDGELQATAEVLGGADSIWVESYRDVDLVESFDLELLDADRTTFQAAEATLEDVDCDVDAWVWRAARDTAGACYVTGPEAAEVARYLGCIAG